MSTLSTLRRASTAVRAQASARRKQSLRKRRASGCRSRQRLRGCANGFAHPRFLWPAVSGFTSCCFRLFREATQLKTVGTVAYVAGIEVLHAEVQEHAVNFADGGCPTVSGVADIEQCAQRIGAVARGGVRLFREATQLKTIGATVCTTWTEIRHGKAQVYSIVSVARRRVAVSVVAYLDQCAQRIGAVARGGVRREDFSFSARKC